MQQYSSVSEDKQVLCVYTYVPQVQQQHRDNSTEDRSAKTTGEGIGYQKHVMWCKQ